MPETSTPVEALGVSDAPPRQLASRTAERSGFADGDGMRLDRLTAAGESIGAQHGRATMRRAT